MVLTLDFGRNATNLDLTWDFGRNATHWDLTWDFGRNATHWDWTWDFGRNAIHLDLTWDFGRNATHWDLIWDFSRNATHWNLTKGFWQKCDPLRFNCYSPTRDDERVNKLNKMTDRFQYLGRCSNRPHLITVKNLKRIPSLIQTVSKTDRGATLKWLLLRTTPGLK